ncbi:MAG: FAD-dependent monooxygenase, partial [Pseudomonadota bacterium]|nr:FAD-dependent monooxygenase [Pseudomonadota bacterium]
MKNKPIIIIGAGISGLTLGLALLKKNINVQIFEKEKEIEQRGAGINISPNGSSILYNLGLEEKINSLACKPNNIELRNFNNGLLLAKQNLNNSCEKKFKYPFFQAQRKDVINILFDEINKINPEIIFFGYELKEFEEKKDHVNIKFNNNDKIEGSLIIGCDGINSKVGEVLNPTATSKFSNIIAWRGVIKMEDLSEKVKSLPPTIWMGNEKHFVHYPIRKNNLLNFIGTVRKDAWLDQSWHQFGNKEDLKKDFGNVNSIVEEIIENIDKPNKWGLFDIKFIKNWVSRRAVIIGDAAHPMSPSYGQGGNSAMEDAIILSRLISEHNYSKNNLLYFQKFRKKRIKKL